jgi:hypothetical protein
MFRNDRLYKILERTSNELDTLLITDVSCSAMIGCVKILERTSNELDTLLITWDVPCRRQDVVYATNCRYRATLREQVHDSVVKKYRNIKGQRLSEEN